MFRWLPVIAYPSFDRNAFARRVTEALLLGIRRFLEEGRVDIHGRRVLGKGTVGIVAKAVFAGGLQVAVKIRRVDASRETLLNEARVLSLVNSHNIGPRLRAYSRNFLVWDYVDGMSLEEWARLSSREELEKTLRLVLEQLWILDILGVAHNELSRFKDHVLVRKDGVPVILDFESASRGRSRSNIPQFLSFLLNEMSATSRLIIDKLSLNPERERIISTLRMYKRGEAGIDEVLGILGL
ncbi:hypothetical protein [Infirmifilum lucidum]|nr:hypothetical protein [Infirmifilum lucidum]